MKYLIYLIALFLCSPIIAQENLILNPNFEEGTLPNGIGQIYRATHWDKGCGEYLPGVLAASPILFDEDQVNDGFFCRLDVPANGFFLNLPGKIGNRYASVNGQGSEYDEWPMEYGTALLATLSEPLTNACAYTFKFHAANRQRYYTWGGMQGNCLTGADSNWEYSEINPNKTIDIVLRKDGNCEDGLKVLSFDLDNNVNWSTYEGTFTLSASDVAEGYDRLEIKRGEVSEGLQVVCDAISLKVDPSATDLDPSFAGATQFCDGDDLTFTGDDGPGTAQYTFWQILETNQYGVPVEGGYDWYSWFPGAPGTFTFPEEVDPPCNRYYWIKMAVNNACTPWEETVQIIHLGCNPKVPKAATLTICRGDCIILADGIPQQPGISYQWFSNGLPIPNGNQLPLQVCPTSPQSYWLIATNTATGCSSTTFFVVDVENLNASWSHSENTSVSPYYYNVTAIANDVNTEDIPGFGYAWKIEKLNNDLEPVCEVYNPSCWWSHPLPTKFKSYNGSCNAGCSSNQAGRFYYGRYYRITRGVWSDACSWKQQAKIFYSEEPRDGERQPTIQVTEVEVSSMEYQLKPETELATERLTFDLFPNPNMGGIFNIKLKQTAFNAESVDLVINDVSGKIVHRETLNGSGQTQIHPASKLPAGLYFVKISNGLESQIQKMIIQ